MRRAFTLIELLVVVAIVAVFASLLFPAFAQAKAAAKRAGCLGDERSLGTAFALYAADHDDALPDSESANPGGGLPGGFLDAQAETGWAREVGPYVKAAGVFLCPGIDGRGAAGGALSASGTAGAGNTGYLLNGVVDGKRLGAAPRPAETILLHELTAYSRASQVRPVHVPFHAAGGKDRSTVGWRYFAHPLYDAAHFGGTNLLFADGHARYLRRGAMTYALFGCPPELNHGKPTNLPADDAEATARYWADAYDSEF